MWILNGIVDFWRNFSLVGGKINYFCSIYEIKFNVIIGYKKMLKCYRK